MRKVVVFGSPEAQEIARFDRAVRMLDAELHRIPTWGTPYVLRYEVESKTYLLSSTEISQQVFIQAWKHLLKSQRWILYQRGHERIYDMFQPVDEGEVEP